jgi:hypothetical protein
MKKSMYGIMISIFFASLACQQKPPEAPRQAELTEDYGKDNTETLYAVSLDTALKGIVRYDSVVNKKIGSVPIKAFTIRSVDLLEAMGMPSRDSVKTRFQYVRVYLGMDTNNNFKIYLTPVIGANLGASPPKAGKDTILSGKYNGGYGRYVLDFSQPCPNTCPERALSNED